MIVFLLWIVVLIAVLALYSRQVYSRFSKYGVKHFNVVPIFGNMTRVVLRMDTFGDSLDRTYNTFTEERFVGRYEFTTPMVFVRDLELVKKITVKDWEYFIDHRRFTDDSSEPLFSRGLFSLRGQEWKDMRSTLSPAFTSSKIKLMVPFMEEVGEQMTRALSKKLQESNTGSIDIDCKDMTTRYSNDVIASCAFGLKVDSYIDQRNTFYEMGKLATTFNFRKILIFLASSACPPLAKLLNMEIIASETKNFFTELVMGTMKNREARNIIRPDMIHLLMEARKGKLSHDNKGDGGNQYDTGFATVQESSIGKKTKDRVWSDNDLIAQAILFLFAGFDTVSTTMSFALVELAIHPEVQDRLVKEIKEHDQENNGKLNFASIQNLKYLDMVISETLRLWPGLALDRLCVKDYNMGKPNSKSTEDYIIKKGELVSIPVWCFHRDPEYFPDPMKFDPDRFSEENKHKINAAAYMPFGVGPRNCIGSRFALCELKVFLYQFLLRFEVSPSEKTQLPPKLSTNSFTPKMAGGHWLKFTARN